MGKAAPKETSRSRQPRSKGAKGGGGDDAALIAVAAALRNIKKVFRVWLILACSVGGLLKTGAVGTDQYFDSTERDSTTMIIGWLELSAALLLSPLATRNRSRDAGCVAIIFAFGLAFGTKSRFRHESSVGVGLAMLLDGTLNAILAFFYARSHAPGKHTLLPSKVALGALVMGALLGFLTSSGQGSEEAEELW